MNIKILVATHKEYCMPEDSVYLPIHVGKAISSVSLPWIGDDSGDNISSKNKNYCELTALYWAWKNLDADYIGLAHYRRHFCLKKPGLFCKEKFSKILTSSEAEKLLLNYDIVLPKQRNYLIETNYSHFIHAHPAESLALTEKILREKYPSYLPAYQQVMNRTKAHRFNMMIMKKERLNDYCTWLFDILFTLEQQIDLSGYDAYNQRLFGFISERLLDVYLEANQLSFKDIPVLFIEKEHWIKKGFSFLKRKFLH